MTYPYPLSPPLVYTVNKVTAIWMSVCLTFLTSGSLILFLLISCPLRLILTLFRHRERRVGCETANTNTLLSEGLDMFEAMG